MVAPHWAHFRFVFASYTWLPEGVSVKATTGVKSRAILLDIDETSSRVLERRTNSAPYEAVRTGMGSIRPTQGRASSLSSCSWDPMVAAYTDSCGNVR
jgi:hypothetical protein